MSNDTVVSLAAPARVSDPLTELLRSGARRLIEAAVSAEFEEYLSAFVQEKLPYRRQRVVRNGHLPERKILTGLGEGGAVAGLGADHGAARSLKRRHLGIEVLVRGRDGSVANLTKGRSDPGRRTWSTYVSALARRSCRNVMASVRTHGPTPKARSTILASPTMPPWMANIRAWPLRSARITSNPLIVA